MLQAERHKAILEIVIQQGMVSVAELCEKFGVSDMTIRRDLSEMAREGLLRRVHGGAVSQLGRSYEPPYLLRSQKNRAVKQRIGQAAAALIYDGDNIALDVGTTTLEIARALQDQRSLTIVTASLPIANELAARFSLESDIRLILTGGIVRAGELSMVGDFTEHVYRILHVDKVFLGIGGVSLSDGLTEYNLEDAMVKQTLLASANQKIVVADSSKLGQTTFVSVGPLSEIDTVITDSFAPSGFVEGLQALGIEVVVVQM